MKSINVQAGLASIIIPCWNQLEFTRQCIAALRRHTRLPWELIVVDNGSTDGTGDYLAGVQDMSPVPVTIVANAQNLGFPVAINQGLGQAHGEYLVLLNNDVVVTEGWLDQLMALASASTGGEGERFTAESTENTETTREGGRLDLTVIDFNEMGADAAEGLTPGPCPSPPLTTPSPEQRELVLGGATAVTLAMVPRGESFDPAAVLPQSTLHPSPLPKERELVLTKTPPSMAPLRRVGEKMGSPSAGVRLAPTIGLVGPMSNYAAPPQLVERVPYSDMEEMHDFARGWREQNRGKWLTVSKLSGFCLLMRRAVYDAIGGLDERFGLGLFDDDDLAERARRAGFELAVAYDLFVHHSGSRTFVGNGVDAEKLLDENQQRFAAKWGDGVPRGQRVALQFWSGATRSLAKPQDQISRKGAKPAKKTIKIDSENQQPVEISSSGSFAPSRLCERPTDSRTGDVSRDHGERATVSLTMIVRDEQDNLPRCLQSVEGVFDEIVIVDTGSTDRTVEIARSFGARVFDFPWVNDFAAARNAALARAMGDYAFWLDADDVVDPPQRLKLEALLKELKAGEEVACVVRCACDPSPDGTGGETVVDHIRLFPLREDVRWTYRVHEQILPALRRANVPVRWTDLTVRHTGYVDRELRLKKLRRDSKILMEELAERPDDPFVLFNLGSIAIEMREWREALDYLRRSLKGSAPTDSITRKLFALIARSHQMLGEPQQALSACAAGLDIDPEDAELLFREAVVRRHIGDNGGAETCWRRILGLRRPEQFSSVDQGIYGHLTRRNLAALAEERGDSTEAAKLWAEVLAECPGDREALAKLEQVRLVGTVS